MNYPRLSTIHSPIFLFFTDEPFHISPSLFNNPVFRLLHFLFIIFIHHIRLHGTVQPETSLKKNTLVDLAYFIPHIKIKAITHTKQYNILPDNAAWIMTENCNIFLRKYIVSHKLIICLGLNYTDNIINNFLIMFNEFEN